MQNHFRIDLQDLRGAAVISVSGELDVASAPQLEQEFDGARRSKPGVIVLDLRQLEFMDSTGLRAVLLANEAATADGIRFGLVKGQRQVQRLLSLTGVADRLVIVDSPDELLVVSEAGS